MKEELALEIKNVSKQYRLGITGTGTISHDFNRWWHKVRGKEDPYLKVGDVNDRTVVGGDYVWALQDINLEVKEGEILGIIGKNGAGKSTLLKLLAKITGPTTGSISMRGRMAALLEVGTGFHPELTGRENIYLNGTILGMSKREITGKLEDIIEFSGCAKYVDTPVKRYSSGMRVRLGFAVAAFLEPDILVVDEVLAVGDVEFQKQAIGKMKEVSAQGGRTVLFVSHNMSSIRNLCDRVVVLNMGMVEFSGNTEEGISYYLKNNMEQTEGLRFTNSFDAINEIANVKRVDFLSNKGVVEYNEEKYQFNFLLNFKEHLADIFLGIFITDEIGNVVFASSTDEVIDDVFRSHSNLSGDIELTAIFPGRLLKPGIYYMTFSLRVLAGSPLHKEERAIKFQVEDSTTFRGLKNRYRSNAIVAPAFSYTIN